VVEGDDTGDRTIAGNAENASLAELEMEISEVTTKTQRISMELQEIALDETQTDDDRRDAILKLGQLRDQDSLDFLAAHISLRIPVFLVGTDEDQLREIPCYMALSRSDDWNAVKAVLQQLGNERTERDLMWSAALLEKRVGREAAKSLLESTLDGSREDVHRANVVEMLKMFGARDR
jgi:hypothetical protein